MWRRQTRLLCAAAASAAADSKVEEDVPPPVEWRLLKPYSWRATSEQDGSCYFHGTTLGPRPMVALPGVLSASALGETATVTTALDPFLRKAAWSHGTLMAPATVVPPVRQGEGTKLFSSHSEKVVTMLDYHRIEWAHLVAYSSGALLAMRLAQRFPDRVGSITLVDTPLITEALIHQDKSRAELAAGKKDINIPLAEIAKFEEKLVDATKKEVENNAGCLLANPLTQWTEAELSAAGFYTTSNSTAVALNQAVYNEVLGPQTLSSDFTQRDMSALCEDHRELIEMRHPMMVVAGQKNSVLNVGVHQQYFNVRKRVNVKDVTNHKQLFEGAAAESIGTQLAQWLSRYEMDTVVANKYAQATDKLAQFEKAGLDKEGASAPSEESTKGKKEGKKGGKGKK